ncbi:hypothetical protein [Acidocella sp.]|jgi:hypothetical protein|nr:hypothetical protein [Acidocella sp.]
MILPSFMLFVLCVALAWSLMGYADARNAWRARSRFSPRARPCPMTLPQILGRR